MVVVSGIVSCSWYVCEIDEFSVGEEREEPNAVTKYPVHAASFPLFPSPLNIPPFPTPDS